MFGDLHPTPGDDTHLRVEEKWFMRAMLGGEVWSYQAFTLSILAGLQMTRLEGRLISDETGGGGIRNVFTRNRLLFGPVIGAEINRRIATHWLVFLAFNTAFMTDRTGRVHASQACGHP